MATEEGDTLFVSELDDKSKEKAKRELNELNDKDREIAVQTFRKWILDQDWLKTPTDFKFLLRFLRARKYSQLEARKTLENYWTCKAKIPEFYKDLDPRDAAFREIIRTGFAFSHKKLDEEGRRIIFCSPGRICVEKMKAIGVQNVYRTFIIVCEWLMTDERTQVNGIRLVCDFKDVGLQLYLIYANYEQQKNLNKYFQKSIPMRLKAMYFCNETTFFDMVVSFFTQFMSPKVKERFAVTGKNLVDLYKYVDKSLLPSDYLPDDYTGPNAGSVDTIIDEMIQDMIKPEFYNYIRDITSSKYEVDINKRGDSEKEPVASFRKLNVD